MGRFLGLFIGLVVACGSLHGQTATDSNEGARLELGANPDELVLAWFGRMGRTYFVQQSNDLVTWIYEPVIEPGTDVALALGLTSTAERGFFRLRHTDLPMDDPLTGDIDGDHVGNWDELQQGTDPFAWSDGDGDLLADDWELFHFGDWTQDAADNDDGDFTDNQDEFDVGLDPGVAQEGVAGSRRNYHYDDNGRLVELNGAQAVSYIHDEEGNLLGSN